MKEFLQNAYNRILKDFQVILSIAYLLAVGVGMLFNYHKYDRFNINIFDYADITDFLIAPFADYRIFLFTLISIIILGSIYRLDVYIRKNQPKIHEIISLKEYTNLFSSTTFNSLSILLIIPFYIWLAAGVYGKFAKKNILNDAPISFYYSDNTEEQAQMIGKTKTVLFLLKNDEVKVVPISSIKSYKLQKAL
ncbi:hypothetical protein ATB99_09030 [Elizabethkingia meningoseptica]|uniref:hypothetical protein n=1 Tax=Elizabethkingia meningoseptica TaxID=238 RepID=UPI000332C292|nr:hypothetical protein [Elizabethkingia meningoseptica]AQX06438.1 hypothetical protein BBD33_14730 [Elizabethkingia meningoseptica]AQX48484.1 hypothetical protein B5G46_14720 [Elizabethkingia meningoseptica]EOR28729.1 hypothetical protein L100_14922 [Elizabethkingia meningoseptica ATCC 13253 = NBRC 12535]KUY16571.1 hypothetical protein ATB99_09030 [Elizabethkingia meningoseptica]OPB74214.1 hypothetical protein BAY30_12960 [Elizabethkingia meningoseptica]